MLLHCSVSCDVGTLPCSFVSIFKTVIVVFHCQGDASGYYNGKREWYKKDNQQKINVEAIMIFHGFIFDPVI